MPGFHRSRADERADYLLTHGYIDDLSPLCEEERQARTFIIRDLFRIYFQDLDEAGRPLTIPRTARKTRYRFFSLRSTYGDV